MPDSSRLNYFEVTDEELQDIITKVPHWIVRWGITVILSFVIVLIALSWFIKYPTTLKAEIDIKSNPAPMEVYAKNNGNLHMLIKENEYVQKGEYLGFIKNNGDLNQIIKLKNLMNSCQQYIHLDNPDSLLSFENQLIKFDDIGFIQGDVIKLKESIRNGINFLQFSYEKDELKNYSNQINNLNSINKNYNNLIKILKDEHVILKNQFERDELLYGKTVISKDDLNKTKLNLLNKEKEVQNMQMSIHSNKLKYLDYEAKLNDLTKKIKEKELDIKRNIMLNVDKIKTNLTEWNKTNSFISQSEGKLIYSKHWVENEYVNTGSSIFSITQKANYIEGIAHLPNIGSGKVKENQEVKIKLHNYPFQEFGMLSGKLNYISPILTDDKKYLIKISLDYPLTTNFGKKIPLKKEMTGDAEIVTKDYRLIERFFFSISKVLQ